MYKYARGLSYIESETQTCHSIKKYKCQVAVFIRSRGTIQLSHKSHQMYIQDVPFLPYTKTWKLCLISEPVNTSYLTYFHTNDKRQQGKASQRYASATSWPCFQVLSISSPVWPVPGNRPCTSPTNCPTGHATPGFVTPYAHRIILINRFKIWPTNQFSNTTHYQMSALKKINHHTAVYTTN